MILLRKERGTGSYEEVGGSPLPERKCYPRGEKKGARNDRVSLLFWWGTQRSTQGTTASLPKENRQESRRVTKKREAETFIAAERAVFVGGEKNQGAGQGGEAGAAGGGVCCFVGRKRRAAGYA